MDFCREEILDNVDVVQKLGSPGKMMVFRRAEAIVTGDHGDDILLAVSECGRGRIAVFTHSAYGKQLVDPNEDLQNATFNANLRKWLTGKSNIQSLKILDIDSPNVAKESKYLQKYDILTTLGIRQTLANKVVEDYLVQGGAFVCAVTPWGWLQGNPTKGPDEIPYSDLLMKLGIVFTKDILSLSGGLFLPQEENSFNANVSRVIDNVNSVDDFMKNSLMLRNLKYLPDEEKNLWSSKMEEMREEIEERLEKKFSIGKINARNTNDRQLVDSWLILCSLASCYDFKAPLIQKFPGDYEQCPKLEMKSLKFSSKILDFYFTGCFVPAGEKVTLDVKRAKCDGWVAMVGAHSDILSDNNISRWPKMVKKIKLKSEKSYDLSWPFGGGLYFISPNKPSEIEFKVQHIVPQPTFDSQNPQSKKDWPSNKNLLGLWADISGKYVTITMPSKSIRDLEDPTEIMDLYDQLLMCYHDLRGSNIDQHRRMWVVTDEQPSAGYMHAGYPIVTQMDVAKPGRLFLLSVFNFKNGVFWGLFHEMGHNMQLPEWTFRGTGEVTVNLFTLYGMEILVKKKAWIHPWLEAQIKNAIKYLKNGATFSEWQKSPGLALCIYGQLINCFTWDAYKKVFRKYSELKPAEKPRDDQSKIDMWFIIFSEITRHNLQPLALFWGVPISSAASDKLKSFNFPAFLPDDEITKQIEDRVMFVKKSFPRLSRRVK